MNLVSVHRVKEACKILYDLLKTRTPDVNISHKEMPSYDEHRKFFASCPYREWDLIQVDDAWIGAIYLTYSSEIGIALFPDYRGKHYGPDAITMFMSKHPTARFLANINPNNEVSIKAFQSLGFKLIQHTYEKTT
jgi:RimJ/RimL family protein N-acetyltransferase